jgi:hypothetical protein
MSYDEMKEDTHPVTISLYARKLKRVVRYTVELPVKSNDLKQEVITSLKSGRKYIYENKRIVFSLASADTDSVGI